MGGECPENPLIELTEQAHDSLLRDGALSGAVHHAYTDGHVAHSCVEALRGLVRNMVDTTGDGQPDALGFDEDGDGIIDSLDIDLDGVPDIKAGVADVIHQGNESSEALAQQRKIALTDLFHAIDSGGDGSIEEEELIDFLSKIFPQSENKAMQENQIKLMIEGLDADGDGGGVPG